MCPSISSRLSANCPWNQRCTHFSLPKAVTHQTALLCPVSVFSHAPVDKFQTFSDLSQEPEMHFSLPKAVTHSTVSLCPVSVFSHAPVDKFQTFSELSLEPEMHKFLSAIRLAREPFCSNAC